MHAPLAALAFLALPGFAQIETRPPVDFGPLLSNSLPMVATDAELSVVLRKNGNGDLDLSVSDGRGLEWDLPIVVDPPSDGAPIASQVVRVHGEEAFMLWGDGRFADPLLAPTVSSVPYLRVFDAQSETLGPEVALPITGLHAATGTLGLDLAVEAVGTGTHVYVGSIETLRDPVTSVEEPSVVLFASHDGGASFGFRVEVPLPTYHKPEQLAVRASGHDVHVFWRTPGEFFGYELWHATSINGGVTVALPTMVPTVRPGGHFVADVEGAVVALGVNDYDADNGTQNTLVIVSKDGGATWGPFQPIHGDGTLTFLESRQPAIAIRPGTSEVTALAIGIDSFQPMDALVRLHSPDGGTTWLPQTHVTTGFISRPKLHASGAGRSRVIAAWKPPAFSTGATEARVSLDGGVTFEPDPISFGTGNAFTGTAWNDRYQNFMALRTVFGFGGGTELHGFRPQDIDLTGFTSGSTTLNIDFANMTGGADLALFVVSSVEGALALPAPDGRITGLGASPLLNATLGLATSGVFLAPITNGAGTTGPIPTLPLQPGLTAFGLGVSIDLMTGAIVDLTDVMRIDT